MKRFELQISLGMYADNIEDLWAIFKNAGLHDTLNQLDAEGCYLCEVFSGDDVSPCGETT